MIVAITGGSGFVGRALVRSHLAAGDQVRILTRRGSGEIAAPPEVAVHRGDLGDGGVDCRPFVDGADVLYHCAAELRAPERMQRLHVDGVRRLVTAAAGRIARWVQLSSVGVYGRRSLGLITEESAERPAGVYETTKLESDRIVTEAAAQGAFACTILRPSIVYGPEMSNRSLFQLVSAIDRGLFFFIGTPGASANYIHVDNVVEALVRCAREATARSRVYNLSDHRPLEEFVGVIAAALGRNRPRLRLPEQPVRLVAKLFGRLRAFPLTEARVDALCGRAVYSCERIERELGYRHPVTMEEGLTGFVAAWKGAG